MRELEQWRVSRRTFLRGGLTLGGAAAAFTLLPELPQVLAAPRRKGRLTDIDHVVILMQENRSFDHYFGTYPAVRGFSDESALPGVFQQAFPPNQSLPPLGELLPYHLDTRRVAPANARPTPAIPTARSTRVGTAAP